MQDVLIVSYLVSKEFDLLSRFLIIPTIAVRIAPATPPPTA
jgi:hypothetical protein